MCGENNAHLNARHPKAGSPPRVRGKRRPLRARPRSARITPACAGKTKASASSGRASTDHPRVCGENFVFLCLYSEPLGSPPRVRGKLLGFELQLLGVRITPACAGKTIEYLLLHANPPDHPRVCGENFGSPPPLWKRAGSPPRVRGKLACLGLIGDAARITPACAGKT